MSPKKLGLAAAIAGSAAAIVVGGYALANASTTAASGFSLTASTESSTGSADTQVTGTELTKVTAAVTAKDSAVTVTKVRKDADGSYDVFGTKAGAPVMFEVSKDLKTVTQNANGGGRHGGGGPGGPGGSQDTPVTGDEAAKVTAAVKAKDSAVTVTTVRKDADGSYDVLGTKAGAPVMFDVSKDLKTVTQNTFAGGGGGGGHHGRDGGQGGSQDTAVTGTELTKVTAAVKAKDSAVTVTNVRKDADGSYDVFGTKAGAQVMFEVSKDLKTITQNTMAGGGRGAEQPSTSGSATTQG